VTIVVTGFRPDLSFLREIRLRLDPAIEAPVALAPLIDPNEHSCGTVRPHGARELIQDDPGFYLAGIKSYGRAPTFLMITSYEQVRSIAADLAGDREAAERVKLELPETGVCTRSGVEGGDGASGCFGGPALSAYRHAAPRIRRRRPPARPAAAVLDGSQSNRRHRFARHRTDAGVGLKLLPAGHPGRSDRARSRNLEQLVLRSVFGFAGDLRIAWSTGRTPDRPCRRPAGALRLERGACRRPRPAGRVDIRVDAVGGVGAPRHRHGLGLYDAAFGDSPNSEEEAARLMMLHLQVMKSLLFGFFRRSGGCWLKPTDTRTGRTVRMFRCKCGECTWSEGQR
jgi:hypothetical protein